MDDSAATPAAPPEPEEPARPLLSTLALLVSNAIPLIGVLFMGWQVFPLVLLYWLENVIVGAFNVLRLAIADPGSVPANAGKVVLIPFFCVHYGMFTLVHGVFILTLFGGRHYANLFPTPGVVLQAIRDTGIGAAAFALFCSHAVSFIWNFLLGGEYRQVPLMKLMFQPYSRVVILHIVILGGAFLMQALHSPLAGLVLLVVLKTLVDLASHHREHRKFARLAGPQVTT
jgi:hypothetical protein